MHVTDVTEEQLALALELATAEAFQKAFELYAQLCQLAPKHSTRVTEQLRSTLAQMFSGD